METKTSVLNLKQKTLRLFSLISEKYWAIWDKKWQRDLKLLEIMADK
jgi:hypothetical protein